MAVHPKGDDDIVVHFFVIFVDAIDTGWRHCFKINLILIGEVRSTSASFNSYI